MKPVNRFLAAAIIAVLSVSVAVAPGRSGIFDSIGPPKDLSEKVIVSLNVETTGNSKVHKVEAGCEMHFGAKAPTYNGDPPGGS